MNVKALAIFLGGTAPAHRAGVLFQYVLAPDAVITRFVADDTFAARTDAPLLSMSLQAEDAQTQRALWADVSSRLLNGRHSSRSGGWLLPAFFQNLLPEGVFRDRIAQLRNCAPNDNFELLAACGRDLPGNVYALPVELERSALQRLVTQNNDALEASVVAEPLEDGVSVSGVQPKVAVLLQGGRYVARTKDASGQHIIAKLPVVSHPRLPELEHLSLSLAAAAGVSTCTARLAPLSMLAVEHGYDLGDADAQTLFLAVSRYDRDAPGRVHCEDMAQAMSVWPEDKYSGSYLQVAALLNLVLGEGAVHELVRRIVVNELLGNPDMHLKNMGLLYPDGVNPVMPGAYDIVGYAAYGKRHGHALHLLNPQRPGSQAKPRVRQGQGEPPPSKPQLSPAVVRQFCGELRIPQKPVDAAIASCVSAAIDSWPALVESSLVTAQMKQKLQAHFWSHPLVQSAQRRRAAVQKRMATIAARTTGKSEE